IFPGCPSARKQVQGYRRSLFLSGPSTEFPSTPPPVVSLQDQASRARYNNNRAGSSPLSERADFAAPAAVPVPLPENVRRLPDVGPTRTEAEDRSDFERPAHVHRR